MHVAVNYFCFARVHSLIAKVACLCSIGVADFAMFWVKALYLGLSGLRCSPDKNPGYRVHAALSYSVQSLPRLPHYILTVNSKKKTSEDSRDCLNKKSLTKQRMQINRKMMDWLLEDLNRILSARGGIVTFRRRLCTGMWRQMREEIVFWKKSLIRVWIPRV